MKNTKMPAIRFKGFNDDWEQRKFSDIAARESSISTSATDIPSVEYEDVVAEEGRLNKDIHLKEAVKSGITFDGSQVLYGKLRPYLHNWLNPDFKGIAVGDWWVLKPINTDKKFLYRLIQTQQFDNIANQSSGSKMPRADWNLISNSEFMVPFSKEEQSKIGRYFDSLDHLITLHQRKLEKIKIMKKSMLEKMFPRDAESIPKIRFDGYTDDWEQRKLGDIASSFEYGLNAAAKEYDGENKYIRITDIDDNTHEFLTDNLTSPDIELTGADNYKLTEGDILFARTGASVGKSYIYRNSDGLVYYAGFLIRARIKEEYDAEFVFQNTLTDRYNKYIAVTSQRSGQPGVNAQEYAEFEIEVPKKEEQTKIGTYFRNIDHLITLHQRKLEKLKEVKKSLLEHMFPMEK